MKRMLIVAIVLLLGWVIVRHTSRTRQADHLHSAPDFSVTDLSGSRLTLTQYRGKVVLLDFWATWCAPCKEEIPHFIEMQNQYGSRGLQVIGISMDDDEPPIRAFQQQFKMNYPVARGSAELATQYGGVLGLPITFIIDRDGRIVSRHIGQTKPEVFEAEIQKLLAN